MLLAIDIGSSSVKAALLDGETIAGEVASAAFATRYEGDRVEVDAAAVDAAIGTAVETLDLATVTRVGLTGMGPAWLALDAAGDAITPIVTHQDRRSLAQARAIEAAIGHERHLALAGNRPAPGGISSTVARWFAEETDAIQRAATLGHLPTYVTARMTGERAIDPSNAAFTGLMDVATVRWSPELCDAAKVPLATLPFIRDAATPIGLTRGDAYGLPNRLPVFGGFVDGSGMLLAAGATAGTLGHSAGSTDVLALCLDRPMPREGLLCRPLGTGGLWVSAATQAAGGAAVAWARRLMFSEMSDAAFAAVFRRAAEQRDDLPAFDPHLAGDRQQVDQPTASLAQLTLAHDREAVLAAIVRGLVENHLMRLHRLLTLAEEAGVTITPNVVTTGGGGPLAALCHARWPTRGWRFDTVAQATLRGLAALR